MRNPLRARRITRDTLIFFTGLGGIIYETTVDKTDRPTLIVAFVAMMGLPPMLRLDEFKTRRPPDDPPPPGPPAAPPAPDPAPPESPGV